MNRIRHPAQVKPSHNRCLLGQTLLLAWPQLTTSEKHEILKDLRRYFDNLRQLPSLKILRHFRQKMAPGRDILDARARSIGKWPFWLRRRPRRNAADSTERNIFEDAFLWFYRATTRYSPMVIYKERTLFSARNFVYALWSRAQGVVAPLSVTLGKILFFRLAISVGYYGREDRRIDIRWYLQ